MFRTVLNSTDLSEYANAVASCLPELKIIGLQKVILLHALDPQWLTVNSGMGYRLREVLSAEASEALETVQADLEQAGISAEVIIETGTPAQVILEVGEAHQVDLIVIGSRGRSTIAEILLGSVAENVIRHAVIPVLLNRVDVGPPDR